MKTTLDALIIEHLNIEAEKIESLIESGINKDKIKEFIDFDVKWIKKVVEYEGYNPKDYIEYYLRRLKIDTKNNN